VAGEGAYPQWIRTSAGGRGSRKGRLLWWAFWRGRLCVSDIIKMRVFTFCAGSDMVVVFVFFYFSTCEVSGEIWGDEVYMWVQCLWFQRVRQDD